jgi:hypothetical protein
MDKQTNTNVQIGNICIQWASLEYVVSNAIWVVLRVDAEVGKIVTGNLDMKQRANMIFALAHQTNAPRPFKDACMALKKALFDPGDLLHRRNLAVHGIHFFHHSNDTVQIEVHRGKGGRGPREIAVSDLQKLGNDINVASDNFARAFIFYIQQSFPGLQSKGLDDIKAILLKTSAANADGVTK